MRRQLLCATFVMLAAYSAESLAGGLINPGIYTLSNHPDGNATPPLYGFRLDELIDATGGHDIFTFDFDDARSDMTMTYNGSTLEIDGTSWGGLDTGNGYDPAFAGLWDISFTFTNVVGAPGDDDLVVLPPQTPNTGTITRQATNDAIPLWDYAGGNPMTFRLGDEDDDLGHRGFAGISGWGWVNHGTNDVHHSASDWLFTAHPVPEPATHLLLVGAASLAMGRRRKT